MSDSPKHQAEPDLQLLYSELAATRRRIRELERELEEVRGDSEVLEKRPDILNLLSETAVRLVEFPEDENMFAYVGQQMVKLLPGTVISVAEYLPEKDGMLVHSFAGISPKVQKAIEMAGGSPIGQIYPINDEFARSEMLTGNLMTVVGGLHELTFGKIPRPIAAMIEKLLSINVIYVMGFARNGMLFGNTVIICRHGQRVDSRLVETIGAQVSVILQRRKAETEKDDLQRKLQQAQRLESVGQLAGGIAHDFNNILTGISGNMELAKLELDPADPLYETVEEVSKAAERAAGLTRQLLTFSRHQIVETQPEDLNEIINGIHSMLDRLIGENISLNLALEPDLPSIRADKTQIEQLVVNLVVNARDAMPNGGSLSVKTRAVTLEQQTRLFGGDLTPGAYVEMQVRDSGEGIPEDVQTQIFDPFFTTKPKGKGTGLGLATVYGVVTKHRGGIDLHSVRNEGTLFRILLPAIAEAAKKTPLDLGAEDDGKGQGTILVVEDEPIVRSVAARILERQGYKVLQAENGEDALATVRFFTGRIDMLVTDVVMPGMNGRELADQLRIAIPNLRVLFTSGYTDDAIITAGVRRNEVNFLGKPYTPQSLAATVRRLLKP